MNEHRCLRLTVHDKAVDFAMRVENAAFKALCFGWGKPRHGAVIVQLSVHFAALVMHRRGNPAAIGLLIAAAIRSTRRAIVDDALARRDIGDRDCIDERNRACAQSANRNLVARPDGKDDLSSKMRPEFYFYAVPLHSALHLPPR